jgi:hypothetical protein
MKTIDIKHRFIVLEYLPWLESPRIIDGFNSQEEAQAEAQKLNSKSLDSSFCVRQLEFVDIAKSAPSLRL